MPVESKYDDQLLVQYLVGQLPPDDAERVDEASIADDALADRLRLVEYDLVDAYVRGRLTGETRLGFESHYLSSPRRRELVTFAGRFARAVDRAAADADVSLRRPSHHLRLIWSVAGAAAVLFIACGLLLMETSRLKRDAVQAEDERAAVEQRAHDLERQVGDLRAAQTVAVTEAERARVTAVPVDGSLVALVLLPQTRAGGPMPTLVVPQEAGRVGFELRLESNDYEQYQAGLRDPAVNRIVWRGAWTNAQTSGGQPSVRLAVPASTLKPQHYSLDLTARAPGRDSLVVGSYAFEVVAK